MSNRGNKVKPSVEASVIAIVQMMIEADGKPNWSEVARQTGLANSTVQRIWHRRDKGRPALGVVGRIGPEEPRVPEVFDPLTCSASALLVHHAKSIDITLAGDLADTARVALMRERVPAWQAARAAVAADARGTGKTLEQMQAEVATQMERLPAALAVAAAAALRKRGIG